MTRTILTITAAALLSLAGCNKKSENPPPSPGASGAPPAAGSAAPAAPTPPPAAGSGSAAPAAGSAAGSGSAAAAQVDVPTEQDFEDKATTKITDKNVEAEVGALEKQLDPSK
jgi:uncharacterized lipoprotein NlpE involved in copper resistance